MDKFTKCWEYFNCPINLRKSCPVFLNNDDKSVYCDGWLYFDVEIGGPAKRGPCSKCKFNNELYSDLVKEFKNWIKE